MFNIINSRTGDIVATASTMKIARRKADRLDTAYGAYVHIIRGAN